MLKIGFIFDSFNPYSKKELEKLGHYYIPLTVHYDDVEYFAGINMTPEEAIERIQSAKKCFTSQPSQQLMEETFNQVTKKFDYVYYFSIASSLSATYNSARVVAQKFTNVIVLNSNAYGKSALDLARKVSKMAEEGTKIEEITNFIQDYIKKIYTLIIPNNLTSLEKNGRLKKTGQIILDKLKMVPVLYFDQTILKIKAVKRTQKKAILKGVSILKSLAQTIGNKYKVQMSYSGDLAIEEFTKKAMQDEFAKLEIYSEICSPIISAHTGYGAVGIFVFPNLEI